MMPPTVPSPQAGPHVHLETANYVVRTLTAQDASDNWLQWLADPELMKPVNTPVTPMTRQQLQGYIRTFDRRRTYVFGIYDKTTGAHIGFYQLKVSLFHKTITFNVMIGERSHWGKDAVLETRAALLDHFFEKCGLEKAIGQPLSRNFPMIYNYKKQGWTLEGTFRNHCTSSYGEKRLDQYQFGLLRNDWRRLRAEAGKRHDT